MYNDVSEKLHTNKEKVISQRNSQGDQNTDIKVGQTVYKVNPNLRNKKHNKLGPYVFVEILDRNSKT